jgi:hypothetical protein
MSFGILRFSSVGIVFILNTKYFRQISSSRVGEHVLTIVHPSAIALHQTTYQWWKTYRSLMRDTPKNKGECHAAFNFQ